jgi:hypothetical protein
VLQHLQAEGAYTISALAHTRDLQLQLQARLGDWLLAAALQEAQQEDGNTTQQPQQQTVAPDWMGGQGSLCYQQRSSFGWPGTRVAGHHFFSLPAYPTARIAPAAATAAPAAGAPPLLHFRAPGDACSAWQEQQEQGRAAGSSDGAAAPGGRPPGSVLCWSEAAEQQLQHSARTARASNTHSLEASPDGRFLAVTHKPVGGSSDGAFTLSIIDCSTGCQVGASTEGVDGPIQWVQRQQQTSTQQQASRQPQHLLFVAADQLEVHCLSLLPAVDAAAAAAAATHQQCVFKDPQRVSVSLAAAGTLDCIVVHAADGLPRQLLFYSGCAGASSSSRQWLWPDNPAAWHELLPLAAVTPCSSSGSGDDGGGAVSSDASVRLIASVAGSWLLARCSSAAAPQGCLHAAHMPAAAGPVSRVHLQPVPLPDHQEQQPQQRAVAWLMEAVFPVSSQQAGGDLQVLVLRSSWQLVGTSPQQPLQPMRHVVHADWYHVLAFQGQQQQQQLPGASSSGSLQAQHAGGCVLPLPVPFFQLAGGAWQPQEGQLALTFSSLLVPLSRLSVDLQQLEAAHAGRQPQQALADGQHAQVQLQQAVPPGFDATAYAAAQLAVPSSADSGVRIPVSLAWHRHRVQRAVLQQLAGDDVTAGAAASDSTSNATPMLLSCYGSYAVKEAAGFEAELLQLLDDGWVVGIAHVRGGGWLGPAWAEAGRCCGKRTSIRDLTDVLEYVQQVRRSVCALLAGLHACAPRNAINTRVHPCVLLARVPSHPQAGVCSPGHLFVQAASAGAWLAASAVLQACAGLVQGVVLSVPCCDPLGLMLHQQQGRLELGDAVADAQVGMGGKQHACTCVRVWLMARAPLARWCLLI